MAAAHAAALRLVKAGEAVSGRVVSMGGGTAKPKWAEAVCSLGTAGTARVRVPLGGGAGSVPGSTKKGDAVVLVLRSVMPLAEGEESQGVRAVGVRASEA